MLRDNKGMDEVLGWKNELIKSVTWNSKQNKLLIKRTNSLLDLVASKVYARAVIFMLLD